MSEKSALTICRRFSEIALPRSMSLQQLVERNRLLSGDYVFSPEVDTWVCARELAELKAAFRARRVRRARRTIWALLLMASVAISAQPACSLGLTIAAACLFVRQISSA